jgi:hypothetical protein
MTIVLASAIEIKIMHLQIFHIVVLDYLAVDSGFVL